MNKIENLMDEMETTEVAAQKLTAKLGRLYEEIRAMGSEKDELRDREGSPSYASNLAQALQALTKAAKLLLSSLPLAQRPRRPGSN